MVLVTTNTFEGAWFPIFSGNLKVVLVEIKSVLKDGIHSLNICLAVAYRQAGKQS